MKKIIFVFTSLMFMSFVLIGCNEGTIVIYGGSNGSSGGNGGNNGDNGGGEEGDTPDMTVTSAGIAGGVIDDKFGINGTDLSGANTEFGMLRSLPVKIENPPAGTVAYALVLEDESTTPAFIHWLVADFTDKVIAEDASRNPPPDFVQGQNDAGDIGYIGMVPPYMIPHTYTITIYALNAKLNLQEGFEKSDLDSAIAPDGVVLGTASISGTYTTTVDINNP